MSGDIGCADALFRGTPPAALRAHAAALHLPRPSTSTSGALPGQKRSCAIAMCRLSKQALVQGTNPWLLWSIVVLRCSVPPSVIICITAWGESGQNFMSRERRRRVRALALPSSALDVHAPPGYALAQGPAPARLPWRRAHLHQPGVGCASSCTRSHAHAAPCASIGRGCNLHQWCHLSLASH